MQRKFFDIVASAAGAVIVVALVVAGSLLLWGANFANSNVHNQLAAQDIYFPTQAQFDHAKPDTEVTPNMLPYLEKYAGQQLLTGQQAEAYADHFIAQHLYDMPYHGVYSTVSGLAMKQPDNAALQAEVETTFKGTTLRGLLLEAYAFSVFGSIAAWAAVASFALAGIMLILVIFGLVHARRTSEAAQLLVHDASAPAKTNAA